ncbi:hypothetical protein G7Y89_g13563 [Cudoniella acicularis]|uniref:Succinate--CoA ligase [ADP-forming] subunit beta, mitochondrial n=1 Tax=Cudoniella acicularis TaxID=354080 RepID=A0A8H4R9E4_9HELO|nr:hypothetical protein G7Y89_g13563 [Cudoniella acicularis]
MFKLARSRPFTAAFKASKASSLPCSFFPAYLSTLQKRALSIHEYLSADLLRQYGVGVPQGSVATTAAEAEAIAKKIGGDDMVIKAQVLAGGRGKGTFDNGLKGGVRVIYSPTEAKMFAEQMIGHKLVTKQTGTQGRLCNSVYICERKFARREFYLAILMDRGSQGPVIVSSSQGGMDIETVAKENPAAINTTYIDIHKGVTDDIARKIASDLGFSEQCIEEAKDTIQKLYKIFMEKDATQIEINPLSETSDHQVLAMDAKLGFDDNAEFRQKEIFSWRDTTQEDAEEVRAAESGLNFIKLGGDIGCLVNGAGLAMATMDIIKLNGGEPANFLDVGGGATPQAIKEAFTLITSDPKVTAIFVNIFGGIVRCDAIAKGLISTVESMDLRIPIIARLQGTNMEAAHKLINDSGLKIFSIDDLQSAAEKAVQFSKVVKMARDIDVGVEFSLGLEHWTGGFILVSTIIIVPGRFDLPKLRPPGIINTYNGFSTSPSLATSPANPGNHLAIAPAKTATATMSHWTLLIISSAILAGKTTHQVTTHLKISTNNIPIGATAFELIPASQTIRIHNAITTLWKRGYSGSGSGVQKGSGP